MLKYRVMPTMLHKDLSLVKGKGFQSWRRTGSLMQTIKVYNLREVDEVVFFDISATLEGREPDYDLVDDFADECFMPLTVGGGITNVRQVGRLLAVGADKVAVNTAAWRTPELLSEIADRYGSQCLVVSIDFRHPPGGPAEVWVGSGTIPTGVDPVSLALEAERRGAGEILLTSVERDGCMVGYDLEITRQVAQAVKIPVIASGGAGTYEHMAQAILEAGASAVAAAAIYHFTEQTPAEAKQHLASRGIPVRPAGP